MYSPAKNRILLSDEEGSAVLEFAVSAVLMMTVVLGIMDTARALYVDNFVSNGAREAVRYAIVRGSTWSGTSCIAPYSSSCMATASDVQNHLLALAPSGVTTSPGVLSIKTTWPGLTVSGTKCSSTNGNNSPGCVVQVRVTYSFSYIFPFLPKNALALSSTSIMAVSQ